MPVTTALDLVSDLSAIVGRRHVLTDSQTMRRYLVGFRFGGGEAVAVVRPANLVQYWRVLTLCCDNGIAVIAQAANTGLTGGSTPFGSDYARDVLVINTMRIKGVHLLNGGDQVVALPGSTLDELEHALKPLGREPHSVIGSSCLGASVIGGVCNNSGGSLIKRGPAYTEMSLFARVDESGQLALVNRLGIELSDDPEAVLERIEKGEFSEADVSCGGVGSDTGYIAHVRDLSASTPARYNSDPRRLHDASGFAGKVMVFAVRLDTFPAEPDTDVFYIGTNDPDELSRIRRDCLAGTEELPIAAEYIHRDAFDLAAEYGKDTFLLINRLGTARLPALFGAKSWLDAVAQRLPFLPAGFSDRLLQLASKCFPSHLPPRLLGYRDRFEHHLMVRASPRSSHQLRALLEGMFPSTSGDWFECTEEEGKAAFLHRFTVAGAAVRYRAVHGAGAGDIVALDIALPRNTAEWVEHLPEPFARRLAKRIYYGHFFCMVFHQDYVVMPGEDWMEVEHDMLALLDQRGAQYPAEHNFGHLYAAPEAVEAHYRALDPCNCFNPGIGQTSKLAHWHEAPPNNHLEENMQ